MESQALIGIIGGILICLIGLLITMIVDLKKDIGKIWEKLDDVVLTKDYDRDQQVCAADKEKIFVTLKEHEKKILIIEISTGTRDKEVKLKDYLRLNGFKMILSQILLSFLCLSFIAVFVCAWYPYDPLDIDSFMVDKKEAYPGSKICYQLKGEKFYNLPAFVTVSLVNGESIPLVSYVSHQKKGLIDAGRCVFLPSRLEHPQYKIKWTAVYFMPLLGTATEEVTSDWVTILPTPLPQRGERGPQGETGEHGVKGDKGDRGGISVFRGQEVAMLLVVIMINLIAVVIVIDSFCK